MKLTEEDKVLLISWGEEERSFHQIEDAMKAKYTKLRYLKNRDSQGESISHARAVELLGRKAYLSGIHRSAFHQTAVQTVGDPEYGGVIYFDSRRLFEE